MIIKKIWSVGWKYKGTFKTWEGWFLFGIIPLYVRQIAWQDNPTE